MTIDMDWSPAFCLACDRQTDGNVYCSEACRLAEYEVASNPGSTASSPTSPRGPVSWSTKKPSNGFFMEPAYNFSNAQPYGTTPSPRASHFYQASRPQSSPVTFSTKPVLTPSSSQSSLFSMQSSHSSTSADPIQLSDESRKALRAYASSFDQSRYSRRQST
jgi:ECL1/2/3 zinc binding proteins